MTKFNKKASKQNSKKTRRSNDANSKIKSKKFGQQSRKSKASTSRNKPTAANRKGNRQGGKFKRNKKGEEEDDVVQVVSEKGDNPNHKKDEESDSQNSDEEIMDTRKMLVKQNKKNKKSGGFQSMGLSHPVYTAVIRKGYKVPTPIQRKTIPLILDGKDMVAMARTGSGKTAAFLIPLFEKLKSHSAKSGARALIMSPTRELALQTLKFTKELGKFTSLRAAVVLGGDRMEDQFAALHENPDIIIATPGRFLHIVVEMDLKLRSIEYVVFDEADRLFEMGFQEQLTEVLQRLPESRQTLLFSATLPKLLVNFAKAGLHDPTLIRLDVDTKLSEQLKLVYLSCRADDKAAILLHLLQNVIAAKEQTVVFAATKHHVEYLNMLLTKAGISCTYIYSSLDPTARKIGIGRFQHRRALVMVVTDLAARGIDIPMLDNVINYHFPAKPKLFVHRVGRVARAGRSGTAYSLVSSDEVAHLLDLHLFLSRPLKLAESDQSNEGDDGLYGEVPQVCVDDADEYVRLWHQESVDLTNMKRVCSNAFKQYAKSRPAPATESIKRVKQMMKDGIKLEVHPIFKSQDSKLEDERGKLLMALKGYKAGNTIFEINSTSKTKSMAVMKEIRVRHSTAVVSYSKRKEEAKARMSQEAGQRSAGQDILDQEELQGAFSTVIGGRKQRPQVVDEEHYLHYRPSDYQTEKGLNISTTFDKEADGAVLDLTGDDEKKMRQLRTQMKWDRKRKRFIQDSGGNDAKTKMFRTESGVWIKSSYKSNAYRDWSQKNKTNVDDDDDDNKNEEDTRNRFTVVGRKHKQWHTKGAEGSVGSRNRQQFKHGKQERKSTEQIFKARQKKERQETFQKKRQQQKQKRRTFSSQMKAKKQK